MHRLAVFAIMLFARVAIFMDRAAGADWPLTMAKVSERNARLLVRAQGLVPRV